MKRFQQGSSVWVSSSVWLALVLVHLAACKDLASGPGSSWSDERGHDRGAADGAALESAPPTVTAPVVVKPMSSAPEDSAPVNSAPMKSAPVDDATKTVADVPAPVPADANAAMAPTTDPSASVVGATDAHASTTGASGKEHADATTSPAVDAHDALVSLDVRMPDDVRADRPFEYHLDVANRGRAAIAGVVLRETLAPGLEFVSSDPEATRRDGDVLVWELDAIAAAESRTVTITARTSGVETVTRSATLDVRLVRETATPVVTPGLALALVFDATGVLLCDDVTGRFVVSNPGTGRTEGVTIHDDLPEGLTTLDGKSSLEVRVGALAVGETREIPFAFRAQRGGAYSDDAIARAAEDLEAHAAPASVFVRQPAASVRVEGPDPSIPAGRTGTFAFVATNTSDVAIEDARLVARLPDSLVFESADAGGSREGERCTWDLGTLAAGETRTVHATYRGAAPVEGTARAVLTGRCTPEAKGWGPARVSGAADVSVRVTDSEGVGRVGEPHAYVCTLRNQGQVELTDVRLAASWPVQIEWSDSDFRPDAVVAGERAEFLVGSIPVGETRTVTFRLKARITGEFKINTMTTCNETAKPVSQDEVTNFVER